MIHITTLSQLKQHETVSLIDCLPLNISQQQLDDYLTFSRDTNPMHVAANGSSKAIVPANLLISIIPSILQAHIRFGEHIQCHTVGYRDVRFRRQIVVDDEIFLAVKFSKIKLQTDNAYVDYQFKYTSTATGPTSAAGVMSDFYTHKAPSSR